MINSRLKRQRNQVDKSKSLRKKKKKIIRKKKLIDTPCERNINVAVKKHVSLENIHSHIVVDNEVVNSSQQTFEQIEVTLEAVLPEISKLNDLVIKEKNNDIQSSFLQKKTVQKEQTDFSNSEMDSSQFLLLSSNNSTPIDGSCYRTINSSILQEIFICLKMLIMQMNVECIHCFTTYVCPTI